ncbi:hypothetical protein [Hyphobacterium sp.]|uniref:hypothetical protein n=1 Tax=Hyphobacterium sp. TaxID=2004662 RepID=UPI003BAD38E0
MAEIEDPPITLILKRHPAQCCLILKVIGPGDLEQERMVDISDLKTRAALATLLGGTPEVLELGQLVLPSSRISCE